MRIWFLKLTAFYLYENFGLTDAIEIYNINYMKWNSRNTKKDLSRSLKKTVKFSTKVGWSFHYFLEDAFASISGAELDKSKEPTNPFQDLLKQI